MLESDDMRYNVIRDAPRGIQLLWKFETVRLHSARLIDNPGTRWIDLTSNLYKYIKLFYLLFDNSVFRISRVSINKEYSWQKKTYILNVNFGDIILNIKNKCQFNSINLISDVKLDRFCDIFMEER